MAATENNHKYCTFPTLFVNASDLLLPGFPLPFG
jgi:hypothetical protein